MRIDTSTHKFDSMFLKHIEYTSKHINFSINNRPGSAKQRTFATSQITIRDNRMKIEMSTLVFDRKCRSHLNSKKAKNIQMKIGFYI